MALIPVPKESTQSTHEELTNKKSTGSDKRWRLLEATMKRHQYRSDALIEVLHKAQELYGYLSPSLLASISKALSLPLSQIYGVATFYHFFSMAPKGRHRCTVCLGTACYVKQSARLLAALEHRLAIHPGETTSDGEISLSTARCLGACGVAPVVVVDDAIAGHQTVESVIHRLEEASEEASEEACTERELSTKR